VEDARRSSRCHSSVLVSERNASPPPADREMCLDSPNKLSEDLVRLTVTIFHKLSKTTAAAELEPPKLNISCIGSRSLVPKAAAMSPLKSRSRAPSKEATTNAGCRRRFVEFTRGSVDVGRVSLCLVDIKNLRSSEIDFGYIFLWCAVVREEGLSSNGVFFFSVAYDDDRGLMQKLSVVDPTFLTNKQKLAFWINVYNFCVMHVLYTLPAGFFPFASESEKLKKQSLSLSSFMVSGVSPAWLASIPGQASRTAEPGLFWTDTYSVP
jgi:hypothetical protein